ncbi:MAG: serine/threonine-protein kinase [Polyangiaceae bacterium]
MHPARADGRPDEIGGYRLAGEIGRGASAAVWEGTAPDGGRVAVKILARGAESARRRFEREGRLLGALDHPGITRLVRDGSRDDPAFLALELVEGRTLSELLVAPLPTEQAADLLVQVVSALGHAHERGVVHRDLKPTNVAVRPTGEVVVLDFGLAQVYGDTGEGISITTVGTRVGTPSWMAPEQAFGDAVDHRADLWSVGVLLYQCLSGRLPLVASSRAQFFRMLLAGAVIPLDVVAPDAPADLAALVRELLVPDPSGRPPSLAPAFELLSAHTPRRCRSFGPPRAIAPE